MMYFTSLKQVLQRLFLEEGISLVFDKSAAGMSYDFASKNTKVYLTTFLPQIILISNAWMLICLAIMAKAQCVNS